MGIRGIGILLVLEKRKMKNEILMQNKKATGEKQLAPSRQLSA
jgi:hypothetical protein